MSNETNKKVNRYIVGTAAVILLLSPFGCEHLLNKKTTSEKKEQGNKEPEKKDTTKKIEQSTDTKKQEPVKTETEKETPKKNVVNYIPTETEEKPVLVTTSIPAVHRDTVAPSITVTDIVTEFRVMPDFSGFTAIDNIDGNVRVDVVGHYDIKKAGIYPMSAVAMDRDGNTAVVSFNLVVNAHPRQPELDAAIVEMTDLYNKLVAAKQDLNNAQTDLDAVNFLLKSNKDKVQALGARVQSLELEKVSAQDDLATKEQELAAAQTRYDEAVEAASTSQEIRNASDAIKAAVEFIQELTNQKNTKEEELAEARGQLTALTAQHEEAKKAVEQATKTHETETAKYNQLKAISDTDAQNKQEAQNALATALTEYNEAKQAYDEAVTKATDSEEFRTAKRELDEAAEVLENVKQLQAQAQTVANEAAENLNNAITAKQAQDAVVAEKQQAKQAAEQELTSAQREVAKAQEALQNAKTDKATAQRNLDNAITAYNAAKTANDNAKAELVEAKKAEENADQALENARQAFQQAQQRITAAQEAVKRGAIGFIENGPDANVLEVVEYHNNHLTKLDRDYKIYKLDPSIKGDPLSFENFEESINYLKRGNELRRNDSNFTGRQDLQVTDYVMVRAASESAMMPEDFNHRRGMDIDGQNIAAGVTRMGSMKDPFKGWYDDEKLVYDTIVKHGLDLNDEASLKKAADIIKRETGRTMYYPQIGHYINLLDEDWKYTGFAVMSQEGQNGWSIIHNHDFARTNNQGVSVPGSRRGKDLGQGTAYTVEEYHTRFTEYKNGVMAELESAKAELANTQALLNELETNGGLTSAQKQAIVNAQNKVNSTQNTLNTATSNMASKEATLTEKTDKVNEAEEALTTKRQTAEDKEQVVSEKNAALATEVEKQAQAQEVVNEKITAKTDADAKLNEAKSNTQAAQATKDEKQQVINDLNSEVAEKQVVLAEKEATKAEKEQALNTATTTANQSQSATDAQKEVIDSAASTVEEKTAAEQSANEAKEAKASEVATKENELATTNSQIAEQETVVAENREIIENANAEVKAASEAVKTAEANKKAAQDNLSTVNNSITETEAEKATTEEKVAELETTKSDKEAVVAEKQEVTNDAQAKYDASKEAHDVLDQEINGD